MLTAPLSELIVPPSKGAVSWRRPCFANGKLVWVHSVMAAVAFLSAETSCNHYFYATKGDLLPPTMRSAG